MKQKRSALSKSSSTHSCTANSREVDVTRKGGAGGCMLGGSEEDLCLPVRSREPGFQPGDPWAIPARPDGCTVGRRREDEKKIKCEMKREDSAFVHSFSGLWSCSRPAEIHYASNSISVFKKTAHCEVCTRGAQTMGFTSKPHSSCSNTEITVFFYPSETLTDKFHQSPVYWHLPYVILTDL